ARGAQIEAIQAGGLSLQQGEQTLHAAVRATSQPQALGQQYLVLVATKATALRDIAALLPPLVGPGTKVAFLQNGMTWWYPIGLPAGLPTPPALLVFELAKVFLDILRPDQVLGGIMYSANEVLRPGL